MLRLLFLLPLAIGLSGCMTVLSARQGDDLPQEKLRDDSKSIVLLHTSLHDARCASISMTLAQRDAAGRWVKADMVTIKGQLDFGKFPSQFVLPAGEYGIVNLVCVGSRPVLSFSTRTVQRGSIWDNSGAIYDKPFATFTVLPGEIVDIGSLRLPTGTKQEDGRIKNVFVGVVTPMPEAVSRALAEKSPELYQRRVTRPMKSAVNI